jgi:Predicted protease
MRYLRYCSRWSCYLATICLLLTFSSSLYRIRATSSYRLHTGHIGAAIAHATRTRWSSDKPPTDAACRALQKNPLSCYSPQELQRAYNLWPLLQRGFMGKGQSIVIIDSFGSPTTLQDLKRFDADYRLLDPPSFQQLSPLGAVPFNPQDSDQVGWAQETSLDVQWAHAMAPQASIVVLTSPVSETQGVTGMPQFLQLEQYALNHHLGTIINQSWSTAENTLFTRDGEQQVFTPFEQFYRRAAARNISIFAASGDTGVANVDVNNVTYAYATVGYPASSPWVTAVGGTSLFADVQGKYQYETVWHTNSGASGGGVSLHFAAPAYQLTALPRSMQSHLKKHRGLPDISMNADPQASVPVYLGFGSQPGYSLFGGTSESAPLWCGITAIANQYAGHNLGFLNPRLYRLGRTSQMRSKVFHDITRGNNSMGTLSGFTAVAGWDAATGWGSPNVEPLLRMLKRRA